MYLGEKKKKSKTLYTVLWNVIRLITLIALIWETIDQTDHKEKHCLTMPEHTLREVT